MINDENKSRQTPVMSDKLRVYRRADGQFEAAWDGKTAVVRLVRCFPWTEPGHYISLRDKDDHEIALIRDLAAIDADSQHAVTAALAEAAFVLEITGIDSIDEEFEIRNWRVQTRQGPRTFQTHRDDWPQPVDGGGFLVADVAGDLFRIPPPERLDPESRKRLRVYTD